MVTQGMASLIETDSRRASASIPDKQKGRRKAGLFS
jgi:hypothetical protein